MTSKRENEIEEKIVMGLERVSELFFTVLSKSAKKHNLNRQQIQIILNLKNKPENLKTLQEKTNQDKSTLSKSLKELKSKKMIFYKEGKDKREKLIFFTEKVNRIDIMKDFLFVKEALKKLSSKEKEIIYKFILGIIDEALRFGFNKISEHVLHLYFLQEKKR
jgi:hypothetical protein